MMSAAYMFFALLALQFSSVDADSSNLHASPSAVGDAKLADTVRALDTNGNGKVDQSELTAFAKSQGLSSDEVLTDFQELDANHDGALDSSEIGPLFGASAAEDASDTEANAAPAASVAMHAEANNKLQKAKSISEKAQASVEAGKKASQDASNMDIDLDGLQHDTQEQAGGVIASRLAQRAQVLLARSAADEHKALAFDAEVRSLRGNATVLAQSANEQTRQAARAASSAVSEKSLAQLKKLQEDEQKSQIAAEERRDQAKQAMERVREAQASLRKK
jgi:hypothetical protein